MFHVLHLQQLVYNPLLKEEEKVAPVHYIKGLESWEWVFSRQKMGSKLLIRIVSTGKAKVTRSAEVTGDIGYKPSANSKLKWRGNEAITTRKLQEIQQKNDKR
ncbi:uncharacterized protein LOC132060840 [Lycium ferocissimum]|uniref:uncharacterized protein LOC132060840 n=1 Tax=Lycium ferocissimum TaxID=112874 RepID=UPI0028149855|nr:uncharacterized protein LOC132060840 [Lycium ferocissimum]